MNGRDDAGDNTQHYRVFMQRGSRTAEHDGVIRVYDEAGNVLDTHEHAGDFKE
jgi:hypothetical protein